MPSNKADKKSALIDLRYIFLAFVSILIACAFMSLFVTPFRDHYHKRRMLYEQDCLYLKQAVCANASIRSSTNLVNRCDAAMTNVFGAAPWERALKDTFESWHPCSENRCGSILAAVGVGTVVFYTGVAATAIALLLACMCTGNALVSYRKNHNATIEYDKRTLDEPETETSCVKYKDGEQGWNHEVYNDADDEENSDKSF